MACLLRAVYNLRLSLQYFINLKSEMFVLIMYLLAVKHSNACQIFKRQLCADICMYEY